LRNLHKVGLDTIEALRYTQLQISLTQVGYFFYNRGSRRNVRARFLKLEMFLQLVAVQTFPALRTTSQGITVAASRRCNRHGEVGHSSPMSSRV
jgi:hypothetical protein